MRTAGAAASYYASIYHYRQKYGDRLYMAHLRHTVEVLGRFGHDDDDLIAAGWLHDSIEDIPIITHEWIAKSVNVRVADIVQLVTNKGPSIATFERIATDPDAMCVKYADRIANVECCHAAQEKRLMGKYARQWPHMRSAFESGDGWDHRLHYNMHAYLDFLIRGRIE